MLQIGSSKVSEQIRQRPGNLEDAPAATYRQRCLNHPIIRLFNPCVWVQLNTLKHCSFILWHVSKTKRHHNCILYLLFVYFLSLFKSPTEICVCFACWMLWVCDISGVAWECQKLSHVCVHWEIGMHTSSDLLFLGWAKFRGLQRGLTWEDFWVRHRNGSLICCCISGAQHAPLSVLLALV